MSRVSTLIKNNFDEKIPECSLAESDLSTNFQKIVLKEQLDNLEIDKVINDIMTFIRSINVFMEQNEPWKLVKSDKVQAGNILYHCAESLRLAAVMLSPVMPSKTKDILDILGTNDVELVWGKLESGSKISISKPIFRESVNVLIDTHAHLYYDNMYDNLSEVLKLAESNNVKKLFV